MCAFLPVYKHTHTHTYELTHANTQACTHHQVQQQKLFSAFLKCYHYLKRCEGNFESQQMAIQFELFTFKRGDSESKASYILSKRSSGLCWNSSRNEKYYRSQKLHKPSWQEKTIGALYVIVYRTSMKVVLGNVRNTNKRLEYRKNWCSFPNNTANICSLMIWK